MSLRDLARAAGIDPDYASWRGEPTSASDESLRLALKAVEHPLGMARFATLKPDVLHVQWLGAPEADRWLFRPRSPAVLTAHDIIPRRTLAKTAMWRVLFDRFQRVVVHSERGKGQLVDFGLPEEKLRVIAHPVFRSEVARRDDGRTALCLGLIRPYKGTEDAIETVLGVERARLLVVGDPRVPLGGLQRTAGGRAEWRLGYLPDAELRQALSEATVGLFPYRAEIDLSGALLQVLGAGVPAIVYDIGGLGEVVGRYGAGAVVPPGDVEAMSAALGRLIGDADALAAARGGAERARDELTWDASAAAHLELYEEIA
jgi:glycosyltransferase involved in cell wall biosynthesis